MRWVSPYLTVKDAEAAIAFYTKAFGFDTRSVMPGPDGKPIHAELVHKDSLVMLGPECPQSNTRSPLTLGGASITLYVYVENVDALFERATAAGAAVISPPKDEFWGDRCCFLTDPEGHAWMFATHVRDVPPEEMHPPAEC
jgi:PhnB protein